MNCVGLTGAIACGKSTVADHLRSRGIPVIDADQLARQVVAPGTPGLTAIVGRFGSEILLSDGTLDRKKLAAIVFADVDSRQALEAITHPEILAATVARLQSLAGAGHATAVVEAALLVETGSWRLYDAMVVVRCNPQTQLARLVARDGITTDEAGARVAAQLSADAKIGRIRDAGGTAVVIDNDGPPDGLRARVERAWQSLGLPLPLGTLAASLG